MQTGLETKRNDEQSQGKGKNKNEKIFAQQTTMTVETIMSIT